MTVYCRCYSRVAYWTKLADHHDILKRNETQVRMDCAAAVLTPPVNNQLAGSLGVMIASILLRVYASEVQAGYVPCMPGQSLLACWPSPLATWHCSCYQQPVAYRSKQNTAVLAGSGCAQTTAIAKPLPNARPVDSNVLRRTNNTHITFLVLQQPVLHIFARL